MERRIDLITKWLSQQDDDDLIEMWNQYQRDNCYESEIWPMFELHAFVEGRDVWDVIDDFCNGSFDHDHLYFAWNGLGHVHSFNDIYDQYSPYDEDELAEFIDREGNDMGYGELDEILHPWAYSDANQEDEDE